MIELAGASCFKLAHHFIRPIRACGWTLRPAATKPFCLSSVTRVHASGFMKQRGIASFFGGAKAENPPRVAKSGPVEPGKSVTPDAKQSAVEVLKEANTSGSKRPREVISTNTIFVSTVKCAHGCVCDLAATPVCWLPRSAPTHYPMQVQLQTMAT